MRHWERSCGLNWAPPPPATLTLIIIIIIFLIFITIIIITKVSHLSRFFCRAVTLLAAVQSPANTETRTHYLFYVRTNTIHTHLLVGRRDVVEFGCTFPSGLIRSIEHQSQSLPVRLPGWLEVTVSETAKEFVAQRTHTTVAHRAFLTWALDFYLKNDFTTRPETIGLCVLAVRAHLLKLSETCHLVG